MPSYRHKRRRKTDTPIMGRMPKKVLHSTPGTSKCETCQATPLERVMCNRNRSYKYPGYEAWLEKSRKKANL